MNGECGIHSWGVAIPRRRVQNRLTQEAWNRPGMPGARCVAGHDEDAITLGVQAALQAIGDGTSSNAEGDPATVDMLIFASTTAPFAEKSCAAVIADTLDLRSEVRCMDLGASRRSGTLAMSAACDAIRAGTARFALIVAADTRLARPGSPDECFVGHGGAALLLGPAVEAKAGILHQAHTQSSQLDSWRMAGSRFPESADVRFSRLGAYQAPMQTVLKAILQTSGWAPSDVRRVVPYSPDVKSGAGLLKKHGFDIKTQYCDRISAKVGLTGTAHILLMLAAALEESEARDRLLVLDQGDGASALALQACEGTQRSTVRTALNLCYDISYNDSLALRNLHAGADADCQAFTSEVMEERNSRLWRGLVAKRCCACDTVVTLPLPTCPKCGVPAEFKECRLQRTGTVFSVTHEHYFPTPEPPLGMAAVDLDGGGRLTLQVADEDQAVRVGDKVELVFRRLHDAGGRPNYFWKCRPVVVRQGEKA